MCVSVCLPTCVCSASHRHNSRQQQSGDHNLDFGSVNLVLALKEIDDFFS